MLKLGINKGIARYITVSLIEGTNNERIVPKEENEVS